MAGSWVKMDPWDKSDPQPQPRQGSWVKMDPFYGPGWTPQPRQGSWVKMDSYDAPIKVKQNGAFGWAEALVKVDGTFVPGYIQDVI